MRNMHTTYMNVGSVAVSHSENNVVAIEHEDCDEIVPVGIRDEADTRNPTGRQLYVDYVVITRPKTNHVFYT